MMQYRLTLVLLVLATMTGGALAALPPTSNFSRATQDGVDDERPGEVTVGGQRFAFDRDVPIDLAQLQELTDDAGRTIYVKNDGGLLNAVYLALPEQAGVSARYLPQYLDAPESTCPSEAIQANTIQGNGGAYVPMGPEPDLTPDDLVEVGSTDDGRTVYALSAEQPFNELFTTGGDNGLIHYVLLPDTGPPPLASRISFGGQQFQLAPGVGGDVNAGELSKVGCAGLYPALTAGGQAGEPFGAIYLQVGDRFIAYSAAALPGTPVATGTPTVAATPGATATDAATETLVPIGPVGTTEPTGTATATSTAAPTETPTPTTTPAPTGTPTPTVAPVPTETPMPTSTPAPTGTPEVTSAAVLTETPSPTNTALPTETPAPTNTSPTAPGETPTATQPVTRPTPTPQERQPRAVVPTLPPEAPPPAVATSAVTRCSGVPGPIGDVGVPANLPTSLQFGGTGYEFTGTVSAEEAGGLTLLGCVGPFEAFRSDQEGAEDLLYLRLANAPDVVYRYEATTSFSVSFEVTDDPRVLTLPGAGDQPDIQYNASDPWVRSVYSSVSLILYVADSEVETHDRIFANAVDADVVGEYVPEASGEPAPEDVLAAAEEVGVHPVLVLGDSGQRFVLVALWRPFGTTTNGWLTLYAPQGEDAPEQLVGLDPRRLDLLVFEREDA